MPKRFFGKIIFLLNLSLLTTSCSNLFYYPSRGLYIDPKSTGHTPEELWFEAEDKTKLYGWYFKSAPKPKALLLYFHGNAENLSSHYVTMLWILKHNIDLMIFSYRGYGRSEGDPSQDGTISDGRAAIRLARERADKMGVPLIVLGQSLGSAISLKSMIDLKASGISSDLILIDSGFLSYKAVANEVMSRSWISWPFQWMAYLVISDKQSPQKRLEDLNGIPILVIHGEKDQVVKYRFGQQLFAEAGEPKQFLRVVGGEHIDAFTREKGHYQKPVLDFIERNLKSSDKRRAAAVPQK